MAGEALFGFVGVVLGSVTTSALTIYKERLTWTREAAARDRQFERDQQAARDAFQRESVLALQAAVADVIKAAYGEMDRLLTELRETGNWAARVWETPTAVGWSEALLSLQTARARVFDDDVRALATELQTLAGESVWAKDLEACKRAGRQLEPTQDRFQEAVARVLLTLY
ncbi:hypothetical protein BX285_6866 [Streptomyces sp. 1114.5]|uniref:hypothetical protein n=1 Tax=unclassified Streptomyces TaxID=2593676 RepID=UPI000BDA5A52|nr:MULTISPECIES: hypothetical protein [unclassified Streptomyces]RKT09762.1 hypothetical protein BX285_6866 [Streptomyces sp. 1114.5]SOB88888.1 hypothetical protein SAMN06272789_7210 [Streptomyces sp. 1331.2]